MGTLVDSSVLLDVTGVDPTWEAWSSAALAAVAEDGPVVIDPVVYAEVSVRFARVEELDDVLSDFVREPLPWAAAFLAGKAHARHRARGDASRSVLPDFLIGAHAAVVGHRLLTRDAARIKTYFPGVELIAP